MSSRPASADGQEGGDAPGMGDEEGGAMNDDHVDEYLDRAQEQGITADITDSQGNIYTVGLEDLAAVGVDISDDRQLQISEEQMNALMQIIEDRQMMQAASEESIPQVPMKMEEYGEEATGDQVTLSILYDGSIKLVTAGNGHESYYSRSQLAEINIDTHNLSDDDIKRIVQLAGAASGEGPYEQVPEKRRKLNNTVPSSGMEERREAVARMQPVQRSYQSIHVPSHSAPSTSSGLAAGPSNNLLAGARVMSSSGGSNGGRLLPLNGGLIGESVKIQNAKGKIVSAIVRYSIPSRGYKVQYADGKFEWVLPDKIIDRAPRPVMEAARDYDHKGYTSEPPPPVSHLSATPSTSTGGGGGSLMLTRRVFAPGGGTGGSGGGGMRAATAIRHLGPGSSSHHHHSHHSHSTGTALPNFCCPVCDRRVYQKEPAYIVIRLPACDACTREKILIVDEQSNGGGGGGSRGRPTTREIATDTSDLLPDEEKTDEPPSAASTSSRDEEEATTPEERTKPTVPSPTQGNTVATVPSPDNQADGEGAEKEDEEEEAASMDENGTPSREEGTVVKQAPVAPTPQEVPLSS